MVRAAFAGLETLKTKEDVAALRGVAVESLV
jgi:ribosomal protein S5